MVASVRYFSRTGNTKLLAEAIAKAANTNAISVDHQEAPISEEVDVLFIGGALYAYGIDKNLKDYLSTLGKEKVKKAVVFSTSWLSKHAITLIKNELKDQGIQVTDEYFYAVGKPKKVVLDKAEEFAKKYV
ncbi:MAG: hypothetical protein IJ215_00350 [Clostridia bacterium]|nr:hypothetical protein [Clostridia bacterium]